MKPGQNLRGKLSLDPKSYAQLKAKLKGLERAVRKEAIARALLAGGAIIHSAAESRAPGKLELQIITGRTLKKRSDPRWDAIVKANAKVAAIGPDFDHWYYRFFEFGASKHDISVSSPGTIAFQGFVRAWAKQTGGIPMRPFLRPAVDGYGEAAVKAMGVVLADEIKKAAR